MKSYPIHENLDTSFVNLSALIKYLRRKQFAGSIRLELGDYAAEIRFDETADLTVRENDRATGRVSEGEEALQRILIRARQPGGIINVYRHLAENHAIFKDNGKPAEEDIILFEPEQTVSPLKEKSFPPPVNVITNSAGQIPTTPNSAQPLPFKLTNNVETRARPG